MPIRVSNIAKNANAAATDDVLVRRFFVIDETAGVAVSVGWRKLKPVLKAVLTAPEFRA